MGLSIRQRSPDEMAFDPSSPYAGTTVSPEEGSINQPGTFNPVTQRYVDDSWWSGQPRPNEYSVLQPNVGMPAPMYALPGSVNTGNQFSPTGGFNPFNPNPYNIDNITQPTDWSANPTSGWESFAPTTGVNPFNANPFNIDNITTPTVSPFGGYPNQTGGYAYPGNLGYSGNPFGSMFGGIGDTGYQTRGNR